MNRTLNSLRIDNFVSIQSGEVRLINFDKLKQIAKYENYFLIS